MNRGICFVLLVVLSVVKCQKDAHFDENRGVIVQLFEWKFSDIADECERFLGPKGYGGVQVSPVSEYIVLEQQGLDHPWFERYQTMSYNIISRSGNEDQFKDMVKRCHATGLKIYVDVSFNHMTADFDNATGTGGSTADTYTKSYPGVPYDSTDFHETCIMNDTNSAENMRNCELAGLHDLDQSNEHVRQEIVGFLNKLIADGVDGLRVDLAQYQWPKDLETIYGGVNDRIDGGRPLIYQDVVDYDGTGVVTKNEYTGIGRVLEYLYGRDLGAAFGGITALKDLKIFGAGPNFMDSGDAIVFVDMHDTQRGGDPSVLTYKNSTLYKMASAFMLAWPHGIPKVMSSYNFTEYNQGPPQDADHSIVSPTINNDQTCGGGWVCEHRWKEISNMVGFHNTVKGTKVENWWDNGKNQIAFSRGSSGFIVFNNDDTDLIQKLQTGLPAGDYCDLISGDITNNTCTGRTITVNDDGTADIRIPASKDVNVIAIHTEAKLSNSTTLNKNTINDNNKKPKVKCDFLKLFCIKGKYKA